MKLETTKHSLRLSHLSVMQQQRALRNLSRACRMRNKEKLLNAESQEANTYDWHRNVRLKREARAYNLIRAYLKGIPYKQVEQNTKPTTITAHKVFMGYAPVMFFKDTRLFDWLEADDKEPSSTDYDFVRTTVEIGKW